MDCQTENLRERMISPGKKKDTYVCNSRKVSRNIRNKESVTGLSSTPWTHCWNLRYGSQERRRKTTKTVFGFCSKIAVTLWIYSSCIKFSHISVDGFMSGMAWRSHLGLLRSFLVINETGGGNRTLAQALPELVANTVAAANAESRKTVSANGSYEDD